MAAAREIVEGALRSEAAVYGLTTAVAERKNVVLDAAPLSPRRSGEPLFRLLKRLPSSAERRQPPGK